MRSLHRQRGFIGSLIGGALGFLGGERQNSANAKQAAASMAFEGQQAQMNRDFQERMSSSAHQREVKDLALAGLNPILSATGGPGASTPAGAKGSGTQAQMVDTISSAQQGRRQALEQRNIHEMNRQIKMDTGLKEKQLWLARDQAEKVQEETRSEKAHGDLLRNQIPGSETEAKIDRSSYGQGIRYIDRIGKTIGSALSARRLFNQGK